MGLASVNNILVDVSSVTDTASNVTSTVSKAANSAVSGVAGMVEKFTGGGGKASQRRKLAAKSAVAEKDSEQSEPQLAPAQESVSETVNEPAKTYFTYGDKLKDE